MELKHNQSSPYISSKIIKTLTRQEVKDEGDNNKFTDKLFPPKDKSLYSLNEDKVNFELPTITKFLQVTSKNQFLSQYALDKDSKQFLWKRLNDVYDYNSLHLYDKLDNAPIIDDVIQGELGDCYFLSALAALAQNPQRILKLIPNETLSHQGVFEVHIFIHGQPITILIDDYFPFTTLDEADEDDNDLLESENKGFKLAFAQLNPKSMNIWPIILEKAWAKCNLSYEDIISGCSADAFKFLTPSPIDTIYHNINTKGLFTLIQNSIAKQYLVVCDMTDTDESNLDSLAKIGLITNHSYSITETIILKDKHDKTIQLLKISNPWDTNKWVGDWSNYSGKWTDQYKETCHLDQKAKGISWICFEDYIQYYTTTHFCHLNDNYQYITSKFKASSLESFNMVLINIDTNASGYFIVNLKNRRIYSHLKQKPSYQNEYCQINVFRKENINENENGHYHFLGSDSGKKDRLYVYCDNMVKGTYYVSVTFPKQHDTFTVLDTFDSKPYEKMSFRVGVYSTLKSLDMKLLSTNDKEYIDEGFFEEIIYNIAKANANATKFVEENENDTKRTISFEPDNRGYGYIYYENHSEAFLRERITFNTLTNINIIPRLYLDHLEIKSEMENEEEIEFEDQSTEELVKILKQKEQLVSSIKVLDKQANTTNTNNNNAIEMIVAPGSSCLLILQKTNEESEINFNSQIVFDYVCSSLLTELKFKPKKLRLKYNNKPIEIFECITEYNTGVLFQYKNKTSEFKITIHVTFTHLDNLYLSLISDDLKLNESTQLRKSIGKFRKDINEEVVDLTVSPGETKFFDVRAIDIYKKFSYSSSINYQFRLSKSKFIDSENSVEEEEEQIQEDETVLQASPLNYNQLRQSVNTSFIFKA